MRALFLKRTWINDKSTNSSQWHKVLNTADELPEGRSDGVIIGVPEEADHQPTAAYLMVETMIKWGVNTVFGMVGSQRNSGEGNLKCGIPVITDVGLI